RNTGRMGQLIDSLLIYSHAGKEKGNYQEVDLNAACKHAMKNLELIIKESNAAIHCDDLPRIQADETQMIQLFQNLIGNAVKFRSNQRLIINIRCKPEEENYVISVKDNGIGIAADYFVRIFEVFRKLHSQTEYPGTGVGLAICKRVVENHGGRIWLNSKEGKGTTFYFSLPQRLAVELSRHRHTSSRAES